MALRRSGSRRGGGGGIIDKMIPGYQDKIWAALPQAVRQHRVKAENDGFEKAIAAHQKWQSMFLSWKSMEKSFQPSQKFRKPAVDWRRQMERGTMHYGRWYEGPNGSDYRPGNTVDRLENVRAPFTEAEWEDRKGYRSWDLMKLGYAGLALFLGYRLTNEWPVVWCEDDEAQAKDYPPHGLSGTVKDCPEWIRLGCGDKEYYCEEKNATFPGEACPDQMPDLSKHSNLCADFLREHPEVYHKYKHLKTKLGVTLAKCIKTGMDNRGHPHITTCGLVAGDEESYVLFKDVFDAVIDKRHGGYAPNAVHPTSLDVSKLSTTKIDPTGKYVLTTRCRTGRSVRGLPLPPSCNFEQRRELERIIVKGLAEMEGELRGEYFGLHGSRSVANAMDEQKEEALRKAGNLFQEPDSTLLLSSGCGRHWPDARGIFHNNAKNFFVWVNEEDHMRIISMEKGDNIRAIFVRFANATQTIQRILQEAGYDFMHNDHLGFILTCPSNLGTGLRAGAMVKIPLFSSRPDFKAVMKKMGLQARGTAGVDSASTGGTWDISNADRLGKSEVELVNIFIEGVAQIIRWEQALEAGKKIDVSNI